MPCPELARTASHPGGLGDVTREMEDQPGRYPGQHGSMPTTDSRGAAKTSTVARECVTGR